jgi:hypothetical protein
VLKLAEAGEDYTGRSQESRVSSQEKSKQNNHQIEILGIFGRTKPGN